MRVRRTHNCLVHSKPWMQQPRVILLTRDLIVIVVFQTTNREVHYHYLLTLVMKYARFNPNFYAFWCTSGKRNKAAL